MRFSLLQLLRDIPIAVVDLETTGASADFGHRVIEIGIVRIEGGRIVAEYEQLVDPGRRIARGITALTGISQAMVDGQPTFEQQLPRTLELMSGAIVLGHNIRFDLSFLRKEFRRARMDLCEALGDVPVMDTFRIARKRFGRGGNGLQRLARRFDIFPSVAHRALADAQTTGMVFERLMEPVKGWDICLCDALIQQGGPMRLAPASPRESLLPLELEEALEQKGCVEMEYVDGDDQRTTRTIKPLHVRRRNGELMLVAECQLRGERRTFKVDRIVQLVRVGESDGLRTADFGLRIGEAHEGRHPDVIEGRRGIGQQAASSTAAVRAPIQLSLFDTQPTVTDCDAPDAMTQHPALSTDYN